MGEIRSKRCEGRELTKDQLQDLLPLRAPAGQLLWLPAGVPAAAGKRAAAHGSAGRLRQRAGQKILTEALRHLRL